jgi:hypothetical protein
MNVTGARLLHTGSTEIVAGSEKEVIFRANFADVRLCESAKAAYISKG